ncbi:hypothetical protein VTH82DRAFT_809 [Thermothelomyces myriococcoides]
MADSDSIRDASATPPSTTVSDRAPTGERVVGNRPEPYPKKRDKLLRGLQRMSSSPSLDRGRSRSASSPYSLSGTLSCASLASTSPFGQPSASSYFSHPSGAASSSAQTSIPTSPIAEKPGQEAQEVLAIRPVGGALPAHLTISLPPKLRKKTTTFNLWANMPRELKIYVLSFLTPKELVRISRVSREFHRMCFDGQLWTSLDASEFYKDIPAESLANIILSAGPFVKDLNLRGCLQMEHYQRAEVMVKACRNLVNATLEGCRNFKRSTLHSLLKANGKLVHLNLTGLPAVNNATCKIVANSCPQLETFNVSWCKHMDARGVKFVVEACPKLKDLRAGEIKGFNNPDVAEALFRTNNLERLVLAGCDDLTDSALQIMMHGSDPEIDYLTGRPMVPPRKLRHLDLTRCSRLTDVGVKAVGYAVPDLEGLQLSGIVNLTDAALEPILASTPRLTYLELEDLAQLTNSLLAQHLAKSPCTARLQHLSVSYCENLSDIGMLPVIRACTRLRSVYMDNTRVSDLVLAEAAAMVRKRSPRPAGKGAFPKISLSLVVYDCPNITWTGVREILSRNTEAPCPPAVVAGDSHDSKDEGILTSSITVTSTHALNTDSEVTVDNRHGRSAAAVLEKDHLLPAEIIALKCFHGWQMTVDEHTKRVLRGDGQAARRLERKWADFMQANEEAGAGGAGGWRRRRRAREAQIAHDEEGGDGGMGAAGANDGAAARRRRRARTTGCAVM